MHLATLLLALALLVSATACGDGGGGAGNPSSPSPSMSAVDPEAQALQEYIAALDAVFAPVGKRQRQYAKMVEPAGVAVRRNDAAAFQKTKARAAKGATDLRSAYRDARREMQSIEPPPQLKAAHEKKLESLRIWDRLLGELRVVLLSPNMPDTEEFEKDTEAASRRAQRGDLKWWVALNEEAERLDVEIPESLARGASPF